MKKSEIELEMRLRGSYSGCRPNKKRDETSKPRVSVRFSLGESWRARAGSSSSTHRQKNRQIQQREQCQWQRRDKRIHSPHIQDESHIERWRERVEKREEPPEPVSSQVQLLLGHKRPPKVHVLRFIQRIREFVLT